MSVSHFIKQLFLTGLNLESGCELFQPGGAAGKDAVAGLGHHSVDRALKNIVKAKSKTLSQQTNKPSCPTKFQKHMAHPSQPILELQKLSIYRLSQKKTLVFKGL